MTLTLYDATIPRFVQTIGAIAVILERGRIFCAETGLDPEDLADTRLHPDMKPLRFQIRAALHFSMGSLDALSTGTLGVPNDPTFVDYLGLEAKVAAALKRLNGIIPSAIDDHAATEIIFNAGERRPRFTAQGLLLSFALPNLHFHATTAYDIIRMRGVPLGKRDYLGRLDLLG